MYGYEKLEKGTRPEESVGACLDFFCVTITTATTSSSTHTN